MSYVPDWLSWEKCKAFANSAFMTSLVGALAGAYAGAKGAQRIAERSKDREQLLTQIRATNSAIMVGVSTCNAALAVKKQHVLPMYEDFVQAKAALQKF